MVYITFRIISTDFDTDFSQICKKSLIINHISTDYRLTFIVTGCIIMIHIHILRFGGINMNFALSTKQKQLLVVALALLLILGITCCSGKEPAAEFDPMGTVSADNLNVRKKPDADAKASSTTSAPPWSELAMVNVLQSSGVQVSTLG